MKLLFALIAVAGCAACVNSDKAGPYPHGFIIGSHMHYWHPKVARALFGAEEKHPEP
jgi:hypothetical protein